ncbi:TolC family protein [Perlucidibaca aquatica]|uniref:TolC family protein n=1 Tax=Perlucidibaca aquatica TaxID=1852776 RepID=UPI00083AAEC3|nr:TolC family protein [Perlucidibaca aquatica]
MNFRISRPMGRVVLALIALVPAALSAASLSFLEAQQVALSQSRQLVAQDAAMTSAREMAVAAGERPDPMLSIGIDNLPVNGSDRFSITRDFMTMRKVGVAQEFTRGEKLDLRRQRQEREAEIAAAGKALVRSEVLRSAGKAWLTSYFLSQQRVLLQEQLQQARQQLVASEAAYRGGRTASTDTINTRGELLLLEDQLQIMARQLKQATAALARWVGNEQSRQPLLGKPDFDRIHFVIDDLEGHLTRHPDLVMQDRRIALADTEAHLAEANKRADWTAELSYAQRGSAFSDMVSLGLSVPLQWDQARRQNRELAARQAQVEQVRAERDDMLRAHVAEVRAMVDDWQSGLSRLQRYREQILPLSKSRTQAALASWRGGRGALSDVLAARRALLDTQLQASQLEMQTALTWADLEFLLPNESRSAP